MTELHHAAYLGELDYVKNCIRGGLDVNAIDDAGYTPLHWLVDMGCTAGEREEILEVLAAAGADMNATNNSGETVLATARRATADYLIPRLIELGAK